MLNPPEPLRKTKTKGEIKMMRDKRWEDRKRGITCAVSKTYMCACVCVCVCVCITREGER